MSNFCIVSLVINNQSDELPCILSARSVFDIASYSRYIKAAKNIMGSIGIKNKMRWIRQNIFNQLTKRTTTEVNTTVLNVNNLGESIFFSQQLGTIICQYPSRIKNTEYRKK
jgi:hypothetical protein